MLPDSADYSVMMACLPFLRASHKERLFIRHFSKRISARSHFNGQMDSCGEADRSGLTARSNRPTYKRGPDSRIDCCHSW